MEKLKNLLEKIAPLVRAKASVINIDRKIDVYQEMVNSLKLHKDMINEEHQEDQELVISEVEEWVENLPKDIIPTSDMRKLIKNLKYLNK